jgi:ATP-binding cassette subfamily C (CFTR/MRP) protein 1
MSFVVSRQGQWLEAIERRISATTSVLGAMKGIKMSGLKHVILTTLHKLRIDELNISKGFRRLLIWNMALGEWLILLFLYFSPKWRSFIFRAWFSN